MRPAVRFAVLGVVAAVSLTCADQSTALKFRGFAQLAIAPVIQDEPEGGPDIEIAKVKGVLTKANGTDSVVTEAPVAGDSAILEFANVAVTGDSTAYNLNVQAFDANNVLVFEGQEEVKVTPGANTPATPGLDYVAPDAVVTSIDIQEGSTLDLRWAGAKGTECLSRASPPEASAVIEKTLTVKGNNGTVSDVRVGWTVRDGSVLSIDELGHVRSKCSNKSTWVVARTFLDVADSILVNVTAPPFSLLMSPDSVSLARGDSTDMTAVLVDENGNQTAATQVTWASSDVSRATVGAATGRVRGVRNGRVIVTASAGGRSTVGIVNVVRPQAANVVIIPQRDTIARGQVRQYFAKAVDALGRVIGDATTFTWSTSRAGAAAINSTNGVVTAASTATQPDSSEISATIDGKTGTAKVVVVAALAPGSIKGFIKDGLTDAPVQGAQISVSGGNPVASSSDGSFLLTGVKAGDDITVSKSGYVSVKFLDAPAFPSQIIQVPNVPLPPVASGNGTMNGKAINALNGQGVSGLEVKAYLDLHSAPSPRRPDATPVASTTTASNGTFTFNLAPGAYTFVTSGAGYSEGIGVGISVGGQTKTTPDIIVPPTAVGGGLYIVLTWGPAGSTTNMPANLDAHLTGPTSSSDATRFQVNSSNRAHLVDGDTVAALDVADATGPGPEVMSLRPSAHVGEYRYYVRVPGGASNKALADSSSARVELFQDGRVLVTFFPPAGTTGNLWEVFRYDGARIFPVGTIDSRTDPLPSRIAPAAPTPSVEPRRRPPTRP